MDWKKIVFIWIYFFLGAGGALFLIKLTENYIGKIFHILERTIKVESSVLRNIYDENKALEEEIDKLEEKKQDLENKNHELEEILFERIKQEGAI
ncbi:hypothetical protein KQI88_10390 [Alkaliphilus sp. MSJ-5]|uniref:Uncharacterized protein n=1 Tax=Alkaliphilus flagellatus TaxID=2841507 RepID=A0ABS6G2W9_9FIRM|nr:hypothetical protein [Alkaliphilus flagellatus]MBU5676827.1 hypothetical protein [Alkaliphilus flagellatus]